MLRARIVPLCLLLGFSALAVSMEPDAKKSADDSDLYEIRLGDGSQVKMRLLTEELEIETRYGRLKVPLSEVRKIEVGFRYPEGMEEKIEAAISKLGDSDFQARDKAAAELLALKELSFPALKRASKSDDPETKRRATALVKEMQEKLPAEQLRRRDHDLVYTEQFPIAGRIEATSLRARSSVFGEVQVALAELRQLRSLASGGEIEIVLDCGQYGNPNQNQWLETEIELEKGTPFRIKAVGDMNLNPQNGNMFIAGPDGNAQWGMNGPYPPGALIGRIGKSGRQFVLGSRFAGEATEAGKLHLRVAPSPWGQMAIGQYTVTFSHDEGAIGSPTPPPGPRRGAGGRRGLPAVPPVKDKAP